MVKRVCGKIADIFSKWSYQYGNAGSSGLARNVADVVAERIEQLIVDGVLKAGQALPSERRLTEARRVAHGSA